MGRGCSLYRGVKPLDEPTLKFEDDSQSQGHAFLFVSSINLKGLWYFLWRLQDCFGKMWREYWKKIKDFSAEVHGYLRLEKGWPRWSFQNYIQARARPKKEVWPPILWVFLSWNPWESPVHRNSFFVSTGILRFFSNDPDHCFSPYTQTPAARRPVFRQSK